MNKNLAIRVDGRLLVMLGALESPRPSLSVFSKPFSLSVSLSCRRQVSAHGPARLAIHGVAFPCRTPSPARLAGGWVQAG